MNKKIEDFEPLVLKNGDRIEIKLEYNIFTNEMISSSVKKLFKGDVTDKTDFDKVKECLREVLIEMKKGGHDQLGSGLAPYSEGPLAAKTYEDTIEYLIAGINMIEERWKD